MYLHYVSPSNEPPLTPLDGLQAKPAVLTLAFPACLAPIIPECLATVAPLLLSNTLLDLLTGSFQNPRKG
jgi:hypothetical protein